MNAYPDENSWWPQFEAECEALYAEAGQLANWGPGSGASRRWSARTAYDICAGLAPDVSAAKHLNELRTALGLTIPLPPVPSRDQVCQINMHFQGLLVNTQQFGLLHWFGPAISSLNAADRQAAYAEMHRANDTHSMVALTWRYAEANQDYEFIPGTDLSTNLPQLRNLVEECVRQGFMCIVPLGGDGQGSGPGFNTDVGWTYGHDWLMANLSAIVQTLQAGEDLTPYCLFTPGFDGVFGNFTDSWTVTQVREFGVLFRQLLPDGRLGLEPSVGYSHLGNGALDYAPSGALYTYDAILSEYSDPIASDNTWQINARLEPNYKRPPDQPAGDDPHPQYYMAGGTPRGPYYHCAWEFDENLWAQGRVSADDLEQKRQYMKAMGCPYTG